jgi:MFS family permease
MRTSRPAGRRPGLPARLSLTAVAGNRAGAMLMAIGAVDSIGTALYLAGGALFFTRIVGLSTAQVGIGLSAGGLVGLAAQTPIGRLADRFGARRVLIIMNLGRAAGFTLYVFAGNFTEMVLIASVLGIGEQAMFPVYQAVVGEAAQAGGQVPLMARIRVVYNIGFTAGGALAGLGLSIGTRTAFDVMFLGNALTFVIAAAVLPYVPLARRPAGDAAARPRGRVRLVALRDWPYLRVSALNSVLTLHISLLSIAIPLWAVQHTRAPDGLVGPLLIVNTLLAVVWQVRATRGTDTVPGAATALLRASLALAACCVLFALAPSLPGAGAAALLVAAVAVMTFGELYQSAGGWGLSFALAPEHSRAEYFAAFSLGTSVQYIAGPALVTLGVVDHGTAGWLVLAVAFLLAGALARPAAAAAGKRLAELGASAAEAGS